MYRILSPLEDLLIDPFDFLGPKRKELLETGWPSVFREYLHKELPVDAIKTSFHKTIGRPTKELHTVLGALVLQQMFDLPDEQAVRQLAFNTEWHYALNIHNEEDDFKYITERTFRNYRSLVVELEIDTLLFQFLTDKLLNQLNIPTDKQRLDSTHIRSDMRRLSRLNLFTKTMEKFLKALRHDHPRLFMNKIDESLRSRYINEKGKGCFAHVKPSESKATLQQVADDLLVLVETFRHNPKIRKMHVFSLLERVLEEQCDIQGEKDQSKVILKDPKNVPSASLQNPSDEDATYSGHKGEGYQAQMMETFSEVENEESSLPDLITYVDVEPSHISDTDAPPSAIEETKERDCAPVELLSDAAYGSDENVQKAEEEGVELIAPTMGKPKSKDGTLILDDFAVNEDTGRITSCPSGEAPSEIREGKNGELTIYFDPAICEECDHRDYCSVGLNDDHAIKYTPKQLRLAQRRVAEESKEFREKYRWRSGIEATFGKLKRKMKLGRLRVRGLGKVRYVVKLKVLGWNIFQAARA